MKRNKSDTAPTARYIKVPLPMFRLLIKDKRHISDVIDNGVRLFAMEQKCSRENAKLQLVYAYQNRNSASGIPLTTKILRDTLDELNNQVGLTDEDYRGFSQMDGSYQPICKDGTNATDYIKGLCKEYPDFAELVMEFHKLRQAAAKLNTNRLTVDSLKKVHEKYKQYDDPKEFPYAYANLDILLKYEAEIEDKSEDDMACLLMYMAYKSIIGDKQIERTSNSKVLARMVGAKGRDKVDGILTEHDHARQFYDRYSKREVFERIRGMVSKYKFIPRIQTIPGKAGHGTFVSCDCNISDETFAKEIFKMVDDDRKRKNREKVARHRAKNSLQKNDTSMYLAKMFGDT